MESGPILAGLPEDPWQGWGDESRWAQRGRLMNTQSHAILTFLVLRRILGNGADKIKHLNLVLFSGAVVPDVAIFVFFGWYTLVEPTSQHMIWRELAFREDWQMAFSLLHSFPLWAMASGAFFAFKMHRGALFCLAALFSSVQDFLVHHDDGHAHLFPFSNYRFQSPVSYWDPARYGWYFSVAEAGMVLAASVWTYRRLQTRWGRALLIIAVVSLLASHAFWAFLFTFF